MKGKIIIKTHRDGGVSINTKMNAGEAEKAILMHMVAKSLEMSPKSIFKYATAEISGYFDMADKEAKTKGIMKTEG